MRLFVFLLTILFASTTTAQIKWDYQTPEPTIAVPGLHKPIFEKNYTLKSAETKLVRAKRLTLAGAIITPVGVGLEVIGWVVTYTSKFELSPQFMAGRGLMILAPFVFSAGIITLPIGIHMKHKWTIVRGSLNIRGGLMINGNAGVVMNF